MVGGHEGDLIHGGLALHLDREGTAVQIQPVKGEGQSGVGRAVGGDGHGLLHPRHTKGNGGGVGVGLDPHLSLVGLARLQGDDLGGLGHGAVF